MKKSLLFLLCIALYAQVEAQTSISGKISDIEGSPLIGATIVEQGTTNGTITDVEGAFKLSIANPNAVLVFSYIGYKTQQVPFTGQAEINITLAEGITLGEIQVVGSRSYNRSSFESPVAIDVIDIADIPTRNGQIEINQILQYAAPSFNASKQSGSDGADHIDPASLRGMGPDQTLVLINGKRRHQSSLINVFGTRGRGNTGTDMNSIPVAAIKRIEVLRDGASAQYGSDAIAGVINIVLKDHTDGLTGSLTYGAYNTQNTDDFDATVPNANGKNRLYDSDKSLDGNTVKFDANYGVPLGDNGGFANITTQVISKERTLRPGASFRQGFGEAALNGFNFMINSAVPINDNTEFYAFGGRNYRATDAYAFSRDNETARNVISIYPDGFTPRITSIITDVSASAGIRHRMDNGWRMDFNNTYGKNFFHYDIKNTINASLEEASPTEFDAGGHSISQNTTGLDFSKYYKDVMAGANLAFGMEYRTENFIIFSGEEGSYAIYDENGQAVTSPSQVIPVDPITGEERPGGSQGFPGYSVANKVDKNRSNLGVYGDGELNLSDNLLVSGAMRFEHYSDFGNTTNFKGAFRYKIAEGLAVRGSISTGFRAPSLAQVYYNLRFTNFVGGTAEEVLLSPNNSPVTRGFGIQPLKQETAVNKSVGVTYNKGEFSATIDGYFINVDNRIVLTDYFDATQLNLNVVSAQFFVNGIDTKTKGVDLVVTWKKYVGDNKLTLGLIGNVNDLEIANIKNGNLDADVFYGPREQYFLQAAAPKYKFGLNAGFTMSKFSVAAAATQFSKITVLGWEVFESDADFGGTPGAALEASKDVYDPRTVIDLNLSYKINPKADITLGSNNLFNAYPTKQDADWTDSGGYWDSVQMGFSGAYYYARLGFTF
ncbi:TonB-dependent receptor [uncultured Imperialibacter sp.]|uniref:TonB-dependent receptor n=1 Tax=uncultured Imperialibacter sp. TaxID=1672639 RepID=UPI0030DB954E|tara:strand:- start:73177 stop:75840 length:2664 start_codon:yes stop_codon:yes gene_type:complete